MKEINGKMSKTSTKINTGNKCTSSINDGTENARAAEIESILINKHAKKANLNGLSNGLVHHESDTTKTPEINGINTSEFVHRNNDHIIASALQKNEIFCKQKDETEISKEKQGSETNCLPVVKSKSTKLLDSNDNISNGMDAISCKLSNNSTIFTNQDPLPSSSNSRALDSQNSDLPELVDGVQNVQLADDHSKRIINYVQYESELQMPMIMKIIQKDLSEPYSIYTYRYFIHNWPKLCFLAMDGGECVGAIVCKLDSHRKVIQRGYIAMLAVDQSYRKLGIGSTLVRMAIQEMIVGDADEVVLETEITNKPALQLYEALGFVRDKRLFRYYLNGVDALRLKLWLR